MTRVSAAGSLDQVRWIDIPSHRDGRGVLTAIESGIDIPFEVERIYFLHDISADRGGHAHRATHQLVVAISGSFTLTLSDGAETREYRFDRPDRGLLLGPMLFIDMTDFSPATRVLVVADSHYDSRRSIRSWEEFLEAIGK